MHIPMDLAGNRARALTGRKAIAASLMGAALTAACSPLAVHLPGNPVPITLQVFAVACCGLMLGSRLAALAQIEYLAAGLLGAPVFAGFKGGPVWLAGPTGGYLVGFVAMAFVVGLISERSAGTFYARFIAGLVGVSVLYTFGTAWLAVWLACRRRGRSSADLDARGDAFFGDRCRQGDRGCRAGTF